jgi:hypothetical protein
LKIQWPEECTKFANFVQQVDIGSYVSMRSPDDPILVHMVRTPCKPGLDEREQHRIGRAELLDTTFKVFEQKFATSSRAFKKAIERWCLLVYWQVTKDYWI